MNPPGNQNAESQRRRLQAFKNRVRNAHAEAFRLHLNAAALVERALIVPRTHDTALALALDMHMLQAFKSHLSALVVAEHGHAEDTATLVRRQLELAIQSVYIAGDEIEDVRAKRATDYVGYLWHGLPEERRSRFPSDISEWWDDLSAEARPFAPTRKRWGPTIRDMFEYAEANETYEQDYRFLSSIAHGSSDQQILQYSRDPIPIRSTEFAGVLLVYGTKYFMVVAEQWNRHYKLLEAKDYSKITQELRDWSADSGGS